MLDRTVGYVKNRHQFNRPIASFQAAQHHVANMHIAIDGAPADAVSGGLAAGAGSHGHREVAIAKLKCNEAYKWATLTAHQLHGGMGFLGRPTCTCGPSGRSRPSYSAAPGTSSWLLSSAR